MRVDKIAKMLIGVENLVVQGVTYDEEQGCLVISARPTLAHARECGKCGRKAPFYDAGRGRRRWRCMDLGGIRCSVESEADRVACPECGVTVRKFPWAAHGSCFTYAFEDTCCWHALNMSKSACAKLMRVEWRTVGDICARVLARLESGRPPRCEGLIRIGIDETSSKKGHKYLTVVVNHDTGAVVWCAAGHGRQVADAFFSGLTAEQRAGIELVSADGARWIADAPAHWAPQAKRCVDPFHVVGWATEALDEVRKQAWREAKAQVKAQCRAGAEAKAKAGSGSRSRAKGLAQRGRGRPKADEEAHAEQQAQAARAVKGLRYPLLKNPESLTPRQAAALELAAISNRGGGGLERQGVAFEDSRVCGVAAQDQAAYGGHRGDGRERTDQCSGRGDQQQDQVDGEDGLRLPQCGQFDGDGDAQMLGAVHRTARQGKEGREESGLGGGKLAHTSCRSFIIIVSATAVSQNLQ